MIMRNVFFLSFLCVIIFCSCSSIKPKPKPKPLPSLTQKELKLLRLMGGKVLTNEKIAIGKVVINRRTKEVSFPAVVQLTQGDLEVLISTPKGRAYESLLVSDIDPYKLQLAMHLSGANNGARVDIPSTQTKKVIQQGDLFGIFIKTEDGVVFPVTNWLKNSRTSKKFDDNTWVFVGSSFNSRKECMATKDGNIVTTWSYGNTIFDNPNPTGNTDDYFKVYEKKIPKSQTPVTVILRKKKE